MKSSTAPKAVAWTLQRRGASSSEGTAVHPAHRTSAPIRFPLQTASSTGRGPRIVEAFPTPASRSRSVSSVQADRLPLASIRH